MPLARPELIPYARFDIAGVEHIPKEGPAIVVGNHRSYFDPMAMALALAKRGRPVRFLGKKEVFDAPIVGQLATAMGGIRVERGTGSDEPLAAAALALEAGELVAMMPEGTIPRGQGVLRSGAQGSLGRGAARGDDGRAGDPGRPVGHREGVAAQRAAAQRPRRCGTRRTVTIRIGRPVQGLTGASPDADTKKIMKAITALLPPEARKKRTPTAEELAKTYPGGKVKDTDEKARRPGTD